MDTKRIDPPEKASSGDDMEVVSAGSEPSDKKQVSSVEKKALEGSLLPKVTALCGELGPKLSGVLLEYEVSELNLALENDQKFCELLTVARSELPARETTMSRHARQVVVEVCIESKLEPTLALRQFTDIMRVPQGATVTVLAEALPKLMNEVYGSIQADATVQVGAVLKEKVMVKRSEPLENAQYLVEVWTTSCEDEDPVTEGEEMEDTSPNDRDETFPGLEEALSCKVKSPSFLVWGRVLRHEGKHLHVAYGWNSIVKIPKPSRGKYKNVKVGSALALIKKSKLLLDGTEEISYAIGNPKPWDEPDPDELPRLKGVVQEYKSDEGEDHGIALVPLMGQTVQFETKELVDIGSYPVGSTFAFYPKFDGDGCLDKLELIPEDFLTIATASPAKSRELTVADLAEGFFSPESRVQTLAHQLFGANAQPFVSEKKTILEFAGGRQLVDRLTTHHGVAHYSKLNLQDIQDMMASVHAHATLQDGVMTASVLKKAVRRDMTHLIMPTQPNEAKTVSWIKRSFTQAVKQGRTLRLVVGVPVDVGCTPANLYNVENCKYFDNDKMPWVRSFTLLEGHTVNYHFDGRGDFVPVLAGLQGKKMMLVEIDSRYQAMGLPQPDSVKMDPSSNTFKLDVPADEQHEVMVAINTCDPRYEFLAQECGGVRVKQLGNFDVLSVPFRVESDAEQFVAMVASKPAGIFAMPRKWLYSSRSLTLTCTSEVYADELYSILDATAILPIGHNRYRLVTHAKMLKVGQVLHKQNRYIKTTKFKALRSDTDDFVLLNGKRPTRLNKYYRQPLQRRLLERKAGVDEGYWFKITNLPPRVQRESLLEKLEGLAWWPSDVSDFLLDDREEHPCVWFRTGTDAKLPQIIYVLSRPCILLPSAPAPKTVSEGQRNKAAPEGFLKKFEAVHGMAIGRQEFELPAATTGFMASHYQNFKFVEDSKRRPPAAPRRPAGRNQRAGRAERKVGPAVPALSRGRSGIIEAKAAPASVSSGAGLGETPPEQGPAAPADDGKQRKGEKRKQTGRQSNMWSWVSTKGNKRSANQTRVITLDEHGRQVRPADRPCAPQGARPLKTRAGAAQGQYMQALLSGRSK